MTHTSTEQPEINELCQWFNEGDGFKQGTAAPHKWVLQANSEIYRQHARIAELEDAADMAIKRIAELEAQLSAIGAGDVEPLRKQAVQAAVQAEVPEAIEQMAVERYKVVPSHESMFHRWAVVAGNGTQQLYIGREVECLNMARKFTGAFLDGAFLAMQNTAPAHPAEGVPAQTSRDAVIQHLTSAGVLEHDGCGIFIASGDASELIDACMAISATHPTQQGLEADLTDEQIDEAFNQMPDGAYGFLKSWGYRQFARAVLAAQAKQGGV